MRVEWLPPAIHDLQRLRDFILPHNPAAACRAIQVIKGAVGLLSANPGLGIPVADLPDFHASYPSAPPAIFSATASGVKSSTSSPFAMARKQAFRRAENERDTEGVAEDLEDILQLIELIGVDYESCCSF